mmetsp:Transcript_63/g.175  ORF Transcript_63/g.175 Transcript_63/m.175 type:complete len:842 (-) Transcript_63:91-2616(-)|eukprot:CAMPEP_0194336116 /NCGR_PEP_ID=MMETSP0171-20130528/71881_1 /TAXON_ID=218684 /ORGANISM="Corethron pennatum, Strain L29A3" /LENGTH=841 /DNA_ID=CAMNT_0039099447 /DNA_START=8 /DNA_END=2533 /DNA_ORIENTATION=+
MAPIIQSTLETLRRQTQHHPSEGTVYYDCSAPSGALNHHGVSESATASPKLHSGHEEDSDVCIYAGSPSERQDSGAFSDWVTPCSNYAQENLDQKLVMREETGCASMVMDGIRHMLSNRMGMRGGTSCSWCLNEEQGRGQTRPEYRACCMGTSSHSYSRPSHCKKHTIVSSNPLIGYDGTQSHYLDDNSRLSPPSPFQMLSPAPSDVAGSPLHPFKMKNTSQHKEGGDDNIVTSTLVEIGQKILEDVESVLSVLSEDCEGRKLETVADGILSSDIPPAEMERGIIHSSVDSSDICPIKHPDAIVTHPLYSQNTPTLIPKQASSRHLPPRPTLPPYAHVRRSSFDSITCPNRQRIDSTASAKNRSIPNRQRIDSLVSAQSRSTRQSYHRRMESPFFSTPKEVQHLIMPFIRQETGKGIGVLVPKVWEGGAKDDDGRRIQQQQIKIETQQHQQHQDTFSRSIPAVLHGASPRPPALDGIMDMEVVLKDGNEELSPMHEDTPRYEGGGLKDVPGVRSSSSRLLNSGGRHYFQDGDGSICTQWNGEGRITGKEEEKRIKKDSGESDVSKKIGKRRNSVLEGVYSSLVRKLRKRNYQCHYAGWAVCKPRLTTSFLSSLSHDQMRYVLVLPNENRLYIFTNPQASKFIEKRDIYGGIVRRKSVNKKCGYCVQFKSKEKNFRWSILPMDLPQHYFLDAACTSLVSPDVFLRMQQQEQQQYTQQQLHSTGTKEAAIDMTPSSRSFLVPSLTTSSVDEDCLADDLQENQQESLNISNHEEDENFCFNRQNQNEVHSSNCRHYERDNSEWGDANTLKRYASAEQHSFFLHLFFSLNIGASRVGKTKRQKVQ